jgi:hypothetical protein
MSKQTQTNRKQNKQTDKQTNKQKIPDSGTIEFQSLCSGVTPLASNPGVGI